MAKQRRVTVGNLAKSAGFSGLSALWLNFSRVLLSPIILSLIGLEGYGVWTLLFSIMATVNFVDVSFGFTYAKFTAECDARESYDELAELIGAGIRIAVSVAVVVLGLLFLVRKPILAGLSVPEEMIDEAATALLFVMSTVMLQMSVGNVAQILNGLQRGDLRAKGQMVASTVYFGLGIGLLSQGWGLVGLAAAYAAGQVCSIGIGWFWAKRVCPELRIQLFNVPRETTRRVLSLGGRYQLIHIANLTSGPGFKMLISALLGPAELGIYELARKLVNLGQVAMRSVISPMMPAFANLQAQNQGERVQALILSGSRLIGTLCWVSFGFLWVFADPIIVLWTGESYPRATWTIRFLMVGVAFQLLTGMGTSNLRAEGRVKLEIYWNTGSTVILLLLAWPLFEYYQYEGLVIARVGGLIIAGTWFLSAFTRLVDMSLSRLLFESIVSPALFLGPILVGFSYLFRQQGSIWNLDGRAGSFIELATWGVAMGITCLATAWFALLSNDEKGTVTEGLRKALRR